MALQAAPGAPGQTLNLAGCTVLCVGGRPATVPLYRLVVERIGGRFLHHDGGEGDSPAKLDALLAAADLVICQTGCASNDTCGQVQDHSKRTGGRCVFVVTPGRFALERALATAMGPGMRPGGALVLAGKDGHVPYG